jgi:stage II sporulation protein P
MSKYFFAKNKSKPKRKIKLRFIMYILIIYLAYNFTIYFDINKNIKISNEGFLRFLLSESNHHILYKYSSNNIINKAITFFSNIKLDQPTTIIDKGLGKIVNINESNNGIITKLIYNDDYKDFDKLQNISEYIKDPNPKEIVKPLVYIYNTHQLENYSMKNLQIYNIKPNVMMASYILREKLNNLNIPTIVEENNLTEFLRLNTWTYKDSYKASRIYVEDAIEKNNTIKYFIDIHRDSVLKEQSTIVLNNKTYAKVMFVVGLENKDYMLNLTLAKDIHQRINNQYKGLSKGILTKKGKGVDGIYNQDISKNAMLIEIGGIDNTIEEVLNTTEILANIIATYIKDNNYE